MRSKKHSKRGSRYLSKLVQKQLQNLPLKQSPGWARKVRTSQAELPILETCLSKWTGSAFRICTTLKNVFERFAHVGMYVDVYTRVGMYRYVRTNFRQFVLPCSVLSCPVLAWSCLALSCLVLQTCIWPICICMHVCAYKYVDVYTRVGMYVYVRTNFRQFVLPCSVLSCPVLSCSCLALSCLVLSLTSFALCCRA